MKSEEIMDLFQKFEAVASELEGVECWSARELQKLLGYSKWENFSINDSKSYIFSLEINETKLNPSKTHKVRGEVEQIF